MHPCISCCCTTSSTTISNGVLHCGTSTCRSLAPPTSAASSLLAGAFAEPADGAALVFRADDARPVEAFVQADPYVAEGLVTSWSIRQWTVVIGGAGEAELTEGEAEARATRKHDEGG